jgi:hypothetical protein
MPIIQSPSIDFTNSDNQSIVYYDADITDRFLSENKLTMSMTAQADQVVIKQNEFFLLNFDLEIEAIPKVVITPIGETTLWRIDTADNKFKIIYQGSADLIWAKNKAFSFDIIGFYITKKIANFQINMDFVNIEVFKSKTVTQKTIIVINKKNEIKDSIKLSAGFDKPQETLIGPVSKVLTFFYQKENLYSDSFTLTFNKDTGSADFKIKKGATIALYFPFDPEDNINAIASTGAGIKQQLNQTDSGWITETIQWDSKGIYKITAQKDEPPMPIELKITNIQLSIPNVDNENGKNIVIQYTNFEGYKDKFDSLLWRKKELKATATIEPNIDKNDGSLYFDNEFSFLKGRTRKIFYSLGNNEWIPLKLGELSDDIGSKNIIKLDDFLTTIPITKPVDFKLTAEGNFGESVEVKYLNYHITDVYITITPINNDYGIHIESFKHRASIEYAYTCRNTAKNKQGTFEKKVDFRGGIYDGQCGELTIYPALGKPSKRKFSCIRLIKSDVYSSLHKGEYITSPDGKSYFEINNNDKLVLWRNGEIVWSEGAGIKIVVAQLRQEGDFRIFSQFAGDNIRGSGASFSIYEMFDTPPSPKDMGKIQEITVSNAGVLEAIDAAGKVIWHSTM